MSEWTDVAAPEEIRPGEHRLIDVDDVLIAVFNIDGSFFAIEDLCSHEEYALAEGEVKGDRITCPKHGAEFCLRTGEALTAPAYEPITTFPVRIHEGRVQVRDDRWD